MIKTVLVRGAGDVGSTVALMLFRAGHRVLLHDQARPAHARRGVAFTDAFFEGRATLDGTTAKRARDVDDAPYMLGCGRALPVSDHALEDLLAAVRPDVVIDARMRKRAQPEDQRALAPLTIGLGPNFLAREHVDLVIETAYGPELGRVIDSGGAKEFAGEPTPLGGYGRERFVYAPLTGTFHTGLGIGKRVEAGQDIGSVGEHSIHAPLTGWLRGLAHDGAEVELGAKIVEVDTSATPDAAYRIGERPRRVAAGVLAAVSESGTR